MKKTTFFSFLTIVGCTLTKIDCFYNCEAKSKWYCMGILISIYSIFQIAAMQKTTKREILNFLFLLCCYSYFLIRNTNNPHIFKLLEHSIIFFSIIHLCYTSINIKNRFENISLAFLYSTVIISFYGIGQYLNLWDYSEYFRIWGTYNNPAEYAATVSFSIPFILYYTHSDKMEMRIFAWSIICIAFIVIILSGSRTGIITCTIIFLIYTFKYIFIKIQWWKIIIIIFLFITFFIILYYTKEDSANGRLLIWDCTINLIKEKPLFGYGYNEFEANYMAYQAKYFIQHPDSKYAMLADNIRHPFNEFLLLSMEFGLCSFIPIILIVIYLTNIYIKCKNNVTFTCILSLLSIGFFSCFSYPFRIPLTWIILSFNIGTLLSYSCKNNKHIQITNFKKFIIGTFYCLLSIYTIRNGYYEYKWYKLKELNSLSEREFIISEYSKLYDKHYKNPQFLYNYSAEMNYYGLNLKSLELIKECEVYVNDYNVQMLKAQIKVELGDLEGAEQSYNLASDMCPSKFAPLYELARIKEQQRDYEALKEIAIQIIEKPVKVPSAKVYAIKDLMNDILKKQSDNRN